LLSFRDHADKETLEEETAEVVVQAERVVKEMVVVVVQAERVVKEMVVLVVQAERVVKEMVVLVAVQAERVVKEMVVVVAASILAKRQPPPMPPTVKLSRPRQSTAHAPSDC